MKIQAPAKINLCLDVLKKTPSRYHKITTIFQEIKSLKDDIKILERKDFDELSTVYAYKNAYPTGTKCQYDLSCPASAGQPFCLLNPEENLAFKALKLVKKTFKIKKFVKIIIKKNIPFCSGLGGSSSNAAAILKGLNKLWKLNLSKTKLLSLAAKLGSDVPFFIIGGTALGKNFGEKLKPLNPIKNIKFEILDPDKWPKIEESQEKTQKMYGLLDLKKCGKNVNKTKKLLEGIKKGDKKSILENLHNDFETIVKVGKGIHLSGSGPAIFRAILRATE